MISHIVMMRFKPDTPPEAVAALQAALEGLPERITEIHTYEFGRDIVHSERSWDFALVSLFANLDTLRRYQQHPEHLKVLSTIKRICSDVAVVDFEGPTLPRG